MGAGLEEAKRAGGEPVWDLMARYLKRRSASATSALNVPRVEGAAGNPGWASAFM
jgi:sulfur-oxidizing protein SoxB